MPAPKEAAAAPVKMLVVLNSSGRVGGAFKPTEYQPVKEGDEPVVNVGLVAITGQSIVEVEIGRFPMWPALPTPECRVGGGALDCSRAGLRPPLKLDVQFSRIQLSRRRSLLSDDEDEHRGAVVVPMLGARLRIPRRIYE
jgi:hypothetical protein